MNAYKTYKPLNSHSAFTANRNFTSLYVLEILQLIEFIEAYWGLGFCLSSEIMECWFQKEGLLKKETSNIERPTSNVECESMTKQSLKPELLNDILDETEKLIKISVTSIKNGWKETQTGVKCSVLDVCFSFNVGRSMFDVRRSSFNTT